MDDIFCRLCLNSTTNTYNIFENNTADDVLLNKKINTIFRIDIRDRDQFSNHICLNCYEAINNFYAFFCEVIKNNETLKKGAVKLLEDTKHVFNSFAEIVAIKNEDNHTEEEINNCVEEDFLSVISEFDNKNANVENIKNSCNEGNDKRNNDENGVDDMIKIKFPEHLKKRISKAKGDAQIKQFIDLICTICGAGKGYFETFKEMQSHYQTEHNTRGYIICCGKKIYRKDRAMDHITNHINPDAFKCPQCGQKSKSKVLLRIHMKQHLPVEKWPYQCIKCEQRFVLKSQLTNHEASHLTEDEKKFVCEECGKAFALKFVLIKHKLTHTKDKKFFCEMCAKPFSCQGNLSAHIKQHDSETPQPRVQCNDCGQWYKNLQTLRTHLHRHRDKREHICGTCGKKCSSKSSLSAHIRYVHIKTSQYECNICEKQFRRKPELTEHMARHTGEILYTCPFCQKTFFSSSNFFAHRKNRHPKEYAEIMKEQKRHSFQS